MLFRSTNGFNLIPIPALDGGKIVMNIIEAIRLKPLNQEIESYITLAGVAVMVVLMIAVTWHFTKCWNQHFTLFHHLHTKEAGPWLKSLRLPFVSLFLIKRKHA